MVPCKGLFIALIVLGLVDLAECEVDETVLLKAQLKLLQGKIDKQTSELRILRERVEQLKQTNERLKGLCDKAGIDTKVPEERNPTTKPDPNTTTGSEKPTVKSTPVSMRRVLLYAFQREIIAKKEKMEVGKMKVMEDTLATMESMLAKGPTTLSYQVLDVSVETDGSVRLSVGCPQEVLDACVAAKKFSRTDSKNLATSAAGAFSIALSGKEALAIRKGTRLIVKGNARFYKEYPRPKGTLAIVLQVGYKIRLPSFINWADLRMESFTILLNRKEVKSADISRRK